MISNKIRLGVNIDHVATIRNARGGDVPDPVRAAILAAQAGADGITAHLREDRRHISDNDIERLANEIGLPLNLEMAATPEMLAIALKHCPHAVCLVPEKRQEITTEGGLDVTSALDAIGDVVIKLKEKGIRVSLFIDPDEKQIRAAKNIAADCVELHTGTYCHMHQKGNSEKEFRALQDGAQLATSLGLEVHAGHGLDFVTAEKVASIAQISELNIGHFLISEAVFIGLAETINHMRQSMLKARRAGS